MTAPYDVFILGSGEPISMRRLAEMVIEVAHKPTQIMFQNQKISVFDQTTDTSKIREHLKWEPLISTREIVNRVIKWRSTTKESTRKSRS